MKNRESASTVEAYKICFAPSKEAELTPKLCRLDNECSTTLKQFFQDENIEYQLAPPYIHRRNAAERARRALKNHIIARLATTDKAFPLHLWDQLFPRRCSPSTASGDPGSTPTPFSSCTSPRAIQLQLTPHRPTGNKGTSLQQAKQQNLVGSARNRRMVFRSSDRTLPLL
jgi:hypothetical protein